MRLDSLIITDPRVMIHALVNAMTNLWYGADIAEMQVMKSKNVGKDNSITRVRETIAAPRIVRTHLEQSRRRYVR